MIKELDRAVLTQDLPNDDVEAGDVDIVIHFCNDGEAYDLEFFALDGHTLVVVNVKSKQVRPVKSNDVMHVRENSA